MERFQLWLYVPEMSLASAPESVGLSLASASLSDCAANALAASATWRGKPRRRTHTQAGWEAVEVSIFNPTAKALKRRGLMDYRGFDGKSSGGWFITKAGRAAVIS